MNVSLIYQYISISEYPEKFRVRKHWTSPHLLLSCNCTKSVVTMGLYQGIDSRVIGFVECAYTL
jgi:hypothetical protein